LEGGIRSGLESRLSALGVTVAQVDVRDIRLDAKTQENLNAIQQTRAQVEQARAKVETAKLEAESIRIRAQADSDADQISRCGAKTVKATEVINGKPQEVDRVIPVPQAECQNRLNEQVIANNWIKALEAIGANGNQIYVVQPGVNPLINLTGPAPK
jgi:regulator of protease activity HflC (stomatin/prohibitin superfamily)